MTKIYKLILVCCAALFLSACAHPDMIKLNDTYDYTVKELGVPDSTTRLPDRTDAPEIEQRTTI